MITLSCYEEMFMSDETYSITKKPFEKLSLKLPTFTIKIQSIDYETCLCLK